MARILAYCAAAAVLYYAGVHLLAPLPAGAAAALRAVLLAGYVAAVVRFEHIPLPKPFRR